MASFWNVVREVLQQSDIVLEVLDARMPEETRNREIEEKIRRQGKQVIYVLNKCDLVDDKEQLEKIKRHLSPSVFVSSTKKLGTTLLKKKILELARGKKVVVGVLGYPNVGKSSVINALAGRYAARTSAQSSFTKALQKIRVSDRIMLLDTPGVFPYQEKDSFKHGLIGAVDYGKMKDPEEVVLKLIEREKELIQNHYGLNGTIIEKDSGDYVDNSPDDDPEEILEHLARKLKRFKRGGIPDTESTARAVLGDWQKGKIKRKK